MGVLYTKLEDADDCGYLRSCLKLTETLWILATPVHHVGLNSVFVPMGPECRLLVRVSLRRAPTHPTFINSSLISESIRKGSIRWQVTPGTRRPSRTFSRSIRVGLKVHTMDRTISQAIWRSGRDHPLISVSDPAESHTCGPLAVINLCSPIARGPSHADVWAALPDLGLFSGCGGSNCRSFCVALLAPQ